MSCWSSVRVSGEGQVVMSDLGDLQETVSDAAKEHHNPATSLDNEASSSATQGYGDLQ